MTKIEYLCQAKQDGQAELSIWYSRQPNGCTCTGILKESGSWLNKDLVYNPERFRSQGCPYHCDHEGISLGGICYCGITI